MKSGVGLRGVLALLCLLASFAYSTRAVMPMFMGAPIGIGVTVEAPHATPMAQDHSEHSASQHATSERHSSSSSPKSEHSHVAHCPFCFSSSFALEGLSFLLPSILEGVQLEEKVAGVQARTTLNRTYQARGPPPLPFV